MVGIDEIPGFYRVEDRFHVGNLGHDRHIGALAVAAVFIVRIAAAAKIPSVDRNTARRVFAGVGRAGFVIGTHSVRGQHDRHLAFFLGDVDLSPDLFAVVIDGHLAHVVLITLVQVGTAAFSDRRLHGRACL